MEVGLQADPPALWEEIREQGYPRGYGSVRDYVSRTLRGKPQPVGPRPPSARAVTRWVLVIPTH